MFEGFAHKRIKTSGTEIALKQGGNGSPLLLVHGYPQSHVMWHKVAPRLAQRFTVVAPDLRGYGASGVATDCSISGRTGRARPAASRSNAGISSPKKRPRPCSRNCWRSSDPTAPAAPKRTIWHAVVC